MLTNKHFHLRGRDDGLNVSSLNVYTFLYAENQVSYYLHPG